MSATLESEKLESTLPNAFSVNCDAPSFPVDIFYQPVKGFKPCIEEYCRSIRQAITHHKGHILVFLPGIGEINKTHNALTLNDDCIVMRLYGAMTLKDQNCVLQADTLNRRKIILATSIAETSLTIPGVTVIIDSGLRRYPSVNTATGMSQLLTGKNSIAGSIQRSGRAGRLEPGICYRLWSQSERRNKDNEPEILHADLTPLALELAQWGISDSQDLLWLTSPPQLVLQHAQALLKSMGALNKNLSITAKGQSMIDLGIHPRLGNMVLRARDHNACQQACLVAALLSDPSNHRLLAAKDDDIEACLRRFKEKPTRPLFRATQLIKQQAEKLSRRMGKNKSSASLPVGVILGFAFPDRIAKLRPKERLRYKLANGNGATLDETSSLATQPYLVIYDASLRQREAKIFSAAIISLDEIKQFFSDKITTQTIVSFDSQKQQVLALEQDCIGQLSLTEKKVANPSQEQIQNAMLAHIKQTGLELLPWTDQCRQWQARIMLLRQQKLSPTTEQALPDVSDSALLETLDQWLYPFLEGVTSLARVNKLDLLSLLKNLLDYPCQVFVNNHAPTHFTAPSGSRIKISYPATGKPLIAVRIQELFSSKENPTIANGHINLQVHLLSPARRPVQITQDLKGFWANSYPDIKRELKGRYPKHHWPEDPINTQAHSSVRPKKNAKCQ
jgi:ATP-dependent helicase HrpB